MRARSFEPLLFVATMIAFGAPNVAFAQNPDHAQFADAPLAEKLFMEGRAFLEQGDNVQACARFEASRKAEPRAVGTILNLAICNRNLGRHATALPLFREVAAKSREAQRQDRVDLAEQYAREIEPLISHLRVTVPQEARVPGLVVRLDGTDLPQDKWDAELPIDRGRHVVEAEAPNRNSFQLEVNVDVDRTQKAVMVPRLDEVKDTRTLGWTIGAVGLASFAIGAGFGISVAAQCGGFFRNTCQAADELPAAERDGKLSSLDTQAWISNVGLVLGAVGMGVGTYLVLSSPTRGKVTTERAARLEVRPQARYGGGALDLRVRF